MQEAELITTYAPLNKHSGLFCCGYDKIFAYNHVMFYPYIAHCVEDCFGAATLSMRR